MYERHLKPVWTGVGVLGVRMDSELTHLDKLVQTKLRRGSSREQKKGVL